MKQHITQGSLLLELSLIFITALHSTELKLKNSYSMTNDKR